MAGIDLSGTLAIVTGGCSGLGIETVTSLVGAGATVIVPARRPEAWVRPGRESQLATNHLGHYVLANLLWPALHRDGGARAIALSSIGHTLSGIRFDDPQSDTGYDKWQAYGQAKTAISLFAIEFDRLGAPFGMRAFAVHPGGIMRALQHHLPREEIIASGWMTDDGAVNERFKSPQEEPPPRSGRRRSRSSKAWAGSTARTATSRSPPLSAAWRYGFAESVPAPSTG